MQILRVKKGSSAGHLVLMFGLGMIGSAIRDALLLLEYRILADLPVDWQDAGRRARAFCSIQAACVECSPSLSRLSVAWAAGITDFFSPGSEVNRENVSFEDALRFILNLRQDLASIAFDFHYISSAGGLFEGQRVVTNTSRPSPIRPYGRMKLAQEQVLQASFNVSELAIYRPSSVYGPMTRKGKHGLINKLMQNGRNRQVTVLDAHVMALRDYVYAGDIGNFVGKRIRFWDTGENNDPVHFLVSSRCASIFEVIARVERILNLHLQFRYDENFGNSSSITFNDSVLPPAWHPSILVVGIRQFMARELPRIHDAKGAVHGIS